MTKPLTLVMAGEKRRCLRLSKMYASFESFLKLCHDGEENDGEEIHNAGKPSFVLS